MTKRREKNQQQLNTENVETKMKKCPFFIIVRILYEYVSRKNTQQNYQLMLSLNCCS